MYRDCSQKVGNLTAWALVTVYGQVEVKLCENAYPFTMKSSLIRYKSHGVWQCECVSYICTEDFSQHKHEHVITVSMGAILK